MPETPYRKAFQAWATNAWADRTIPNNAWLGWEAACQHFAALLADPEAVELVEAALFKVAHNKPAGERPTVGECATAALDEIKRLAGG